MAINVSIKERIEIKTEQWHAANKALTQLLKEENVSYSFGDGAGNQSARKQDIDKLQNVIKTLENEIEVLEKKVNGGGIRTFGVNRHP